MSDALRLAGITKRFGRVEACKDVDLRVASGSIHALVGENGAGKSTLMNIAYGLVRADAGDIHIKGEAIERRSHTPASSIAHGVGMVHQHFMLIGSLSVVENTVLGNETARNGLLDLDTPARELAALAKRHNLDVDPWARVDDLSVGQQQRVEILKVLWRGSDVLILDEPTAVLTPAEVRDLFDVLRTLVADRATVVIITHKLDEVVELAERVTVMRRGQNVAELAGAEISAPELAKAMVGRPVLLDVPHAGGDRDAAHRGEAALVIDKLVVNRANGVRAVSQLSLQVRPGEIVGIAGVEGNGQTELVEAITGLRRPVGGSVWLDGRDVTAASVRRRFEAGLCHVPEDRHHRGLVLDLAIDENLILGRQREFSSGWTLDAARIDDTSRRLIDELDIRPPDPGAVVRGLSGGNQQKVVVARELTRPEPRVLVCAQPTRGVDIGAIELIHARILAARDAGLAVLLLSAELSELRALSDRVVVMYRGHIVDELSAAEVAGEGGTERIGMAMTGASSVAGEGAHGH